MTKLRFDVVGSASPRGSMIPRAIGPAVGVVLCLALCACVAGSGESHHAAAGGFVSQFLLGLWHGIIAPLTLLVEIINRLAPNALPWKPRMYEPSATGWLYDLGFYLGLVGSPVFASSRFSR
jgi:hypothetical protein